MKRRGITHWVTLGRTSTGCNYTSAQITLTDGRTVTVYDDGTVGIQSTAPFNLPSTLFKGFRRQS